MMSGTGLNGHAYHGLRHCNMATPFRLQYRPSLEKCVEFVDEIIFDTYQKNERMLKVEVLTRILLSIAGFVKGSRVKFKTNDGKDDDGKEDKKCNL